MGIHSARFTMRALALGLAATLASGWANAGALLEPALLQRLTTALPLERLEIVIVYTSPTRRAARNAMLRDLGIVRGPVSDPPDRRSARDTAQIRALKLRGDVRSSTSIVSCATTNVLPTLGARSVPAAPELGYTGAASRSGERFGIDATHADLPYAASCRKRTALTNLSSIAGLFRRPMSSIS